MRQGKQVTGSGAPFTLALDRPLKILTPQQIQNSPVFGSRVSPHRVAILKLRVNKLSCHTCQVMLLAMIAP